MARPKLYASPAEKQAAYRARLCASTAIVDRHALDLLHQHLQELQRVVQEAARRGDPLARCCAATCPDTVIEKLTAAFRERPEKGT